MTGLDALRRVVARARNGKAQSVADLDALDAAVAAIAAGTSADKALGLKRAKAGRPRMTPEQREADIERVMQVLELVAANKGLNQDEAALLVVGSESKLHTMNRRVARFRRIAEMLLEEEAIPVEGRLPDDPSAQEEFRA